MPLTLTPDDFGSYANALYLAHASDLAYYDQAKGGPLFKEELGLDAQLISVGNTQVYVGTNDQAIVVAFRGTEAPTKLEGLKDWLLTNANNFLILPEGQLGTDFVAAGVGARFHRGFMAALADIWDPLFQRVTEEIKKQDRPLWITGHSLGGALATLAAWRFLQKFVNIHQVYTFGAPMVGNQAAADAFDRELEGKFFRYVDAPDPVPLLPTFSLLANSYRHCSKEMAYDSQTASAAAAEMQALGQAEDQGWLDKVWDNTKKRVGAHDIASYIKWIKAKLA